MRLSAFSVILALGPDAAAAHVSEKAIVLLLPTDVFSLVGTMVVALTFVALAFAPARRIARLTARREPAPTQGRATLSTITSSAATIALLGLIALGFWGPRDPLGNLLVLTIWTLIWIILPVIQGVFGDLWRYINPWCGLLRLMGRETTQTPLPNWLSHWLALPQFAAGALFALVYIAPDDPAILAQVVLGYWGAHLTLALVFGKDWLTRAEPVTVLFCALASSFPKYSKATGALGVFAIAALATGSFDSLNETFWWLARIDINPLEFPGRSGVIWPNAMGYLASLPVLAAVFLVSLWLGLALVGENGRLSQALGPFAMTLLPIFLGYHIAHFLTATYVNLQYVALALNDPLDSDANHLGIGDYYVTTGIFNTIATVRVIWLMQAGAIVVGHMVSIVLAHSLAHNMLGDARKAAISQIPIAVFMVAYTLLGLWLLASPTAG